MKCTLVQSDYASKTLQNLANRSNILIGALKHYDALRPDCTKENGNFLLIEEA
jgi:hypothetical protein